jgi:hypothetical protein
MQRIKSSLTGSVSVTGTPCRASRRQGQDLAQRLPQPRMLEVRSLS